MTQTPDTTAYMILAVSVAFGTLALYALSLYVRARNLIKERETLNQLRDE